MLNRLTKISRPIVFHSSKRFGSSHGAPVKIQIDKQATWIKLRGDRSLQAIEGIEDTHQPLPQLIKADPAGHIRNVPWYDGDSFFYGEPYYHTLDHGEHSTVTQGYAFVQQPNESNFDMIIPSVYFIGTVFMVFIARQYTNLDAGKVTEQFVAEADAVEELAHQKLQEKVDKIKKLKLEIQGYRS